MYEGSVAGGDMTFTELFEERMREQYESKDQEEEQGSEKGKVLHEH